MKTSTKTNLLFVFGAVLGLHSACQKDAPASLVPESTTTGVQQQEFARQTVESVFDILEMAINGESLSGKSSALDRINGCGTLIFDTLSNPKVITADFGLVNCTGSDGHTRRGKVSVTFTGVYREAGSVYTYATDNFHIDDNRIDALRSIRNEGYKTDPGTYIETMHFTISDDVTITLAGQAGVIAQQSLIDRNWIEGDQTPSSADDVYLLSGSHRSILADGTTYQSETRSSLRKANNYPFITAGAIKASCVTDRNKSLILDYGYPNNGRDNKALVTFNDGSTAVIDLK